MITVFQSSAQVATTLQSFFLISVPFAKLSYGENHYKNFDVSSISSIHAEENAIKNLKPLPKQKNLKKVDLLVIKVSITGKLGSSKPCYNCLTKLSLSLPEKGYKLNKVYYSTRDGTIESCKLNELINEENPHISRFYKRIHFMKNEKENCIE